MSESTMGTMAPLKTMSWILPTALVSICVSMPETKASAALMPAAVASPVRRSRLSESSAR
jgi:hypothetical protein